MTGWMARAVPRTSRAWALFAALLVVVLIAAPVSAGGGDGNGCNPPTGPSGGSNATPEIKPAAAAGALTLVLGASLIAADRRRRTALEPAQA